jgi:hypothetical protein
MEGVGVGSLGSKQRRRLWEVIVKSILGAHWGTRLSRVFLNYHTPLSYEAKNLSIKGAFCGCVLWLNLSNISRTL